MFGILAFFLSVAAAASVPALLYHNDLCVCSPPLLLVTRGWRLCGTHLNLDLARQTVASSWTLGMWKEILKSLALRAVMVGTSPARGTYYRVIERNMSVTTCVSVCASQPRSSKHANYVSVLRILHRVSSFSQWIPVSHKSISHVLLWIRLKNSAARTACWCDQFF